MGRPLTLGQDALFTAGPRHGASGRLFFRPCAANVNVKEVLPLNLTY